MAPTMILTVLLCLQLPDDHLPEAAATQQAPQPLSLSSSILASRKVEALLRRKMQNQRISVDLTNQPLVDFVRYVEEKSGVPIRLDRIGLNESGILSVEPITGHYVDLPAGRILSRCLEDLDSVWLIKDEAVLVTSRDAARKFPQTRVIHVSDLLEWIERNTASINRDRFGLANAVARRFVPGLPPTTRAENELTSIVTTFGSGFWSNPRLGGRTGRVSIHDGVVVIRQSPVSLSVASRLVELLKHVSAQPPQPVMWYVQENGFGEPANQAVVSKLQQKTTFESADAPLEDVIDYLARELGISIHVDVVSLEEAGVLTDEPITLPKTTATLASILSMVLNDLKLVYLPRDNGLFVTTTNLAFEYHVSAVFDVRDLVGPEGIPGQSLLDMIMRETSGQWDDTDPGGVIHEIGGLLLVRQNLQTLTEVEVILHNLRHASSLHVPPAAEANGAVSSTEFTRFYRVESAEQIESLKVALISFVFPDKWEANGGTGFMQEVGSALVVRQSPEVHEAIGAFLAELNGNNAGSN